MTTKIYFICPNNKHITGGVKQIYRQVEILNKNGFEAYVLHKKAVKDNWFHSNVPIKCNPYVFKLLKFYIQNKKIGFKQRLILSFLKQKSHKIDENSILVFPEIYGNRISKIEPNVPKVIFNQGCFLTLNYFDKQTEYENPYLGAQTLATIVASGEGLNYLNYTFPTTKIHKITLGIDASIFNYFPDKKKQICFMPRKLSEDVTQVISILELRGQLPNWSFVSIDNKSEKEVAQIMKESVFFLNFSRCEGFGLPPAEAMACGCYVIGYHGEGGKEFFKSDFCSVIDNGDIISFVQKIEEMAKIYEENPNLILEKNKKASEFILENYSMEKEEKSIVEVWNKILKNEKSV